MTVVWTMMLSMRTVETPKSMTRCTMGRKALDPATLRETMPHSLWVFVPSGQLEDGSVVLNYVQEGTGNRSKYALDATSQGGCEL